MIHSMSVLLQRRLHPPAIHALVRLRARRPHGRPAAAIEQLELNAGGVDRAAHQPAQRVDLANQVSLRRPADRRIARHVRDGIGGQRAQPDVRATPRGRRCGLTAGVAGANHDDVEERSVICRCRTARKYVRADLPARGRR